MQSKYLIFLLHGVLFRDADNLFQENVKFEHNWRSGELKNYIFYYSNLWNGWGTHSLPERKRGTSVPDPNPDPRVFLASRIRIHYSEVWIRIRLWIRILLSSCKNNKKNLES
jgi:hypothetical protein